MLLEEEMRRCLRFFVYYREKWTKDAAERKEEGGAAYARR